MTMDYPMKSNGMYIIRKEDFDDIGEAVLLEYMSEVLRYPTAIDIMALATECLYLDVKNKYITQDGSILGMIAFGDTEFIGYGMSLEEEKIDLPEGTVLIDYRLCGLENMGRRNFTVAHECGHWVCHRPYHSPNNKVYEFRKNKPQSLIACRAENIEGIKTSASFNRFTDEDWEEWQADSFAAAILMPRKTFIEAFREALKAKGVRRDYLIKGDDSGIEASIIHYLMRIFEVSYTAVKIRLKNLGLMRDYSNNRHWGYANHR